MVAYLDQAGVQHLIAKIRNTFWPVGTILATSTNTSPASYLGGSWEAYAPGRTLVGVSTTDTDFAINKQGGAKTVDVGKSTNLTTGLSSDNSGNLYFVWRSMDMQDPIPLSYGYALETHAPINWNRKETRSGVKVFGNLSLMEPYVTVYYWRRIA